MSLYAIADTHLSFVTDKPMDKFGRRWQDYAQKLERNWRAVVSEGDTVVVAGDISWAMRMADAAADFRFLASLPGKKLILKGNHDYYFGTVGSMRTFLARESITGFDFIHNSAEALENFIVCGTRGWYADESTQKEQADRDKIVAREAIRLELSLKDAAKSADGRRETLVFTHFPIVFGDYVCRELLDVLHAHGIKRAFFGHIHGNYTANRRFTFENIEFTLISADFLNFIPLKILPQNSI